MASFDTLEDVLKDLNSVSIYKHISGCGLTLQRLKKLTAEQQTTDNELITISNLMESHAVVLRKKAAMRYKLMLDKGDLSNDNQEMFKNLKEIIETKCPTMFSEEECVKQLCSRVAELPKEWTCIQITSGITNQEIESVDPEKWPTNPLYFSVFNCGQSVIQPFLVKIPEPRDGLQINKLELMDELRIFLKNQKDSLMYTKGQKKFSSHKNMVVYYNARQEVEENLKKLIKDFEMMWLKEWRCLLIGKYHDSSIDHKLRKKIEKFLKEEFPLGNITQKTKELLYYLTKGTPFLSPKELKSGIKQCFENESDDVVIKLLKFMTELADKMALEQQKRFPVILVVDESYMDCFPWEMLDVLQDEPVSRVPSLHFVYFLYKIYEKDIENGYKVIKKHETGSYVINPDRDLETMEARMMGFLNYWIPKWTGIHNRKPTDKEFLELVTNSDIFSYSGHGNGAHILPMENLQKTFVRAVVLLFGCGSTKITKLGPQAESYGSYHMYLIARCPCVVGMLWEVTDLDTDVLTSDFISHWIPSEAPVHWKYVAKAEWQKGHKKLGRFEEESPNHLDKSELYNCELQRALALAKKSCRHESTKAACIVRGLPVKIKK